jgi:hypothetical protein
LLQHAFEARMAVSILGRKIRAADERLQIGSQPHAHRPATVSGRRLHERHVDAIDVRPLLAVDFDVHELAVHDLCRRVVLERLVRHHVAPVAGRVADREEDRLLLASGFLKRLVAPRQPFDWIVRVLQQVGRLLLRQAVWV